MTLAEQSQERLDKGLVLIDRYVEADDPEEKNLIAIEMREDDREYKRWANMYEPDFIVQKDQNGIPWRKVLWPDGSIS